MSTDLQFSHKLDYSAVQYASQRDLIMLASITGQTGGDRQRAPLDLVAVLDRSGSMAGGKLNAVKETVKFLVQQMSAVDRLSIVTFSNDVLTDLPLRRMNESNKAAAQIAISKVYPSGGTNLSGGLFKGIDQHQQISSSPQAATEQSNIAIGDSAQQARSERVRTVFLFTDGQATTGVTNSAQLESILSMMLQNPVRPTIYTFGFGADYDSECLGAIAQAGQGQSSFIEDAESIAPALATALGGLMSMSAQNVELTFTPKEGVTISDVETSFRVNAVNGAFTVTLGDLYAEEKKDFLVRLQVAAVPEPQDNQEIVTLSLRFLDLATGSMKSETLTASISRPQEVPEGLGVDADMQEAMHRVNTANAIRAAVRTADAHNLPQARTVISDQLTRLATGPNTEVMNSMRGDLSHLLDSYSNPGLYQSSRNHALSMAVGHSSQRTAGFSSRNPSLGPGLRSEPYSTRSQTMYAERSTAVPVNGWRNPSTNLGMQGLGAPPSLRGPPGFVQPPAFGQAHTAAAAGSGWLTAPAAGNHPNAQGLDHPAWGLARQGSNGGGFQPTALTRRPSNVSAAATEVYDPVVDGDMNQWRLAGEGDAAGAPGSYSASFGFNSNPTPSVGTPAMMSTARAMTPAVSRHVAPAAHHTASGTPRVSQSDGAADPASLSKLQKDDIDAGH